MLVFENLHLKKVKLKLTPSLHHVLIPRLKAQNGCLYEKQNVYPNWCHLFVNFQIKGLKSEYSENRVFEISPKRLSKIGS